MRSWLVATLLIAVTLSGCATTTPEEATSNHTSATLGDIDVGGGALNVTEEGAELVFDNLPLPFTHDFKVPEGATMVRFVADPRDSNSISVSMKNLDTGRRRCNQQPVVGFGATLAGERSCSTITALDAPGTMYRATASGTGNVDATITFLTTPVDGFAGQLNLDLLSQADHEILPTQSKYIGAPGQPGANSPAQLWVEWTLPQGEGPWPTVIASSPYNGETNRLPDGTPAMWEYWTQDWAKRGYAAVNVDVRGYGKSTGCVEVWGINEQHDQKFIVDWVAGQDWSDGNVGFYGQSYVGTTPVAAAVQAPPNLKAIIAVAPVINAYEDWHYGGVPNGEGALSPVAYQVLTAAPAAPDTQNADLNNYIQHAATGVCDPTLLPLANSPTAEYNELFYEVRDFKLRADQVEAAVLFTEGFEDANVKSAMIPGWFNEIQAPKLGVFGHWLHQHPARMDQEVLFVGWMDQHVKGKDIGFDRLPSVLINAENDLERTAEAWPPVGEMIALAVEQGGMLDTDPAGAVAANSLQMSWEFPLDSATAIVAPEMVIKGIAYGENAFLHAELIEQRADGSSRTLTWGRINLALRDGYDNYQPLTPGGSFEASLPFRPTEHVTAEGSSLLLVLRGVQVGEAIGLAQPQHAVLDISGESALMLHDVSVDDYRPVPISALP